jgi:hypothetical protein
MSFNHSIRTKTLETCKGKVVSVLVIKYYTIKAYGGVDVEIYIFLISSPVGGQLHGPGAFTPREIRDL